MCAKSGAFKTEVQSTDQSEQALVVNNQCCPADCISALIPGFTTSLILVLSILQKPLSLM